MILKAEVQRAALLLEKVSSLKLETRPSPDTIIHWRFNFQGVRSKRLGFKLHDLWCSVTKTDHKPVCEINTGYLVLILAPEGHTLDSI